MPHWRKRNPPASRFNAYLASGLGNRVFSRVRNARRALDPSPRIGRLGSEKAAK
jgi:hypothetical protein